MKADDKIKKSNPFRVPEGYFGSLTGRTMGAIRSAEAGEAAGKTEAYSTAAGQTEADGRATGRKLRVSFRPYLALAAAILGFAVLAAAMVRLSGSDNRTSGYEPGTSLYADLAFEEVDAYTLEIELAETEPVSESDELTEEIISSETIIEYLMTEDIDINDIYELL